MANRFSEHIHIDENQGWVFEIENLHDLVQQGLGGAIESMQLAQIVVKSLMSDFGTEKTERHRFVGPKPKGVIGIQNVRRLELT